MEYKKVIHFLNSFFMIFDSSIYDYQILKKTIKGRIIWNDEDEKQEFSYDIKEENLMNQKKLLCEYLVYNKLMRGDKIMIEEKMLCIKFSKHLRCSLSEVQEIINSLCETEIKMIDNNEETDSFFIHF